MRRILVSVEPVEDGYRVQVNAGREGSVGPWRRLDLGRGTAVRIKGTEMTLGELVDGLIHYRRRVIDFAFDERGQRDLGRFLFQQLFRSTSPEICYLPDTDDSGEIRLLAEDERILRIPWILLADDEGFLAKREWSVSLSPVRRFQDGALPALPKMLVVAPQPSTLHSTQAKDHLADLRELLTSGAGETYPERFVRTVETWEDMKAQVKDLQPDVVYYYGHGEGDRNDSVLLFPAPGGDCQKVSMSRFAHCLEDVPSRPQLVYLNCCYGDAGGFLGAGMLLRRFVPAVVANRTVIEISAARALALRFWEAVLLDGMAPHAAQAAIHRRLYDLEEISYRDPMWMTPVLHASYDQWKSQRLRADAEPPDEPYAEERFDRSEQIGFITSQVSAMVRDRRPHSYAFLWYGETGQGVDLFHDHLRSDFRVLNEIQRLQELRPMWPADLARIDRSFASMYTEIFEVDHLDQLPAQIHARVGGAGNQAQLIYIRHPSIDLTRRSRIDLITVKLYLEWVESNVIRCFEPPNFVVLGIGFEVSDGDAFYSELRRHGLHRFSLASTWVRISPPLRSVKDQDLVAHLQRSGANIPLSYYDRVIDHIMDTTQGEYELTLQALHRIKDSYWELIYREHSGCGA